MPLLTTKGAGSASSLGITSASGPANYIEDVFSCFLYTGTGTSVTQRIASGIDLATKGGMVWTKNRTEVTDHQIYDTARGERKYIRSNTTDAEFDSGANSVQYKTSGWDAYAYVNELNKVMVSWTFRKQPKFFDVVTYTGDGIIGRTVAHNLGSVPGFIVVKKTNSGGTNWRTYHTSLGATYSLSLNTTAAATTLGAIWADTEPTSSVFSVGDNGGVNASGDTYVAYLFAHDAGGFGLSGTDNVISCGSFTKTASWPDSTPVVLGWEPQFVLFKRIDAGSTENWNIGDVMRGASNTTGVGLSPNLSNAETSTLQYTPLATGFTIGNSTSIGGTYIYIAIRRGPMKVPTLGTSVYNAIARTGNSTAASITGVGFAPDWVTTKYRAGMGYNHYTWDRLRGPLIALKTSTDLAENSGADTLLSFGMDGINVGADALQWINYGGNAHINWFFRRAPSFFDEVCYTGDGTANRSITHNLGVIPEFYITRARSGSGITIFKWGVYSSYTGLTQVMQLSLTNAATTDNWWGTNPLTATSFSVSGNDPASNNSTGSYVAYLFASCPGVSKVGSYTGTGALQTINCGFTSGARFVLIKRTDSTGNWWTYDSARGISSGNDPYLYLNSTAAEVTGTNYVDTDSTGFKVTAAAPAELNANGGTYIFLAIA